MATAFTNDSYQSGTKQSTNWLRVGHQTSAYNNDAVWKFTPPADDSLSKYSGVTFNLSWNNTSSTGGPGTGWTGKYNYVFVVSTSGSSGRTAATGTHLAKITKDLEQNTGQVTLSFTGLSLTPGTTYYLRANQNGTTYKTLKCFNIADSTATASKGKTSYLTDPHSNWTATGVKKTYTVGYNANGHGTAPSSQTKTHGTALTLQPFISNVNGTESTVTITGHANGGSWSGSNGSAKWRPVYSQTHWNTASNGSGTNYGSKGSYTANSGTTLYAIWKTTNTGTSYTLPTGTPTKANGTTNTLTVTFNANGGSTTKSSQTSSKTVTYTFKGWFTASSGGTQRTTSSRVTAAETVYAQYNSSTGSQSSVTLPTTSQCTRSGFTLLGFSTSSTATTATYNPGASYTPSASIILYAVWQSSGRVKVYNGSAWVAKSVKLRSGSSWETISVKRYNGSSWG